MQIKIDSNDKEIQKLFKRLPKDVIKKSEFAGLKKSVSVGRSKGAKKLATVAGIKLKTARRRVTQSKVRRGDSKGFINFFTKHGVLISKALSKSKLKTFKTRKSFAATMPSGHFSVFERTGKPKKHPKQGRYKGQKIKREPIEEIKIPTHPHGTNAAKRVALSESRAAYEKELLRQINWRVDKLIK